MRYVVTELEGYAKPDRRARAGLSVQVIDTATCHRVVKAWRSEDYRHRHGNSFEWARKKGREHAAALNGGKTPPRDKGFRATCPLCAVVSCRTKRRVRIAAVRPCSLRRRDPFRVAATAVRSLAAARMCARPIATYPPPSRWTTATY